MTQSESRQQDASRGTAPVKIIGFDNWTGGAIHFKRLVKAFDDNGMKLTLIHLGSWGNDQGRPIREMFDCLEVRDIAYYHNDSLLEILRKEQPAAVLFMSTDTFAHRAFNRYCRHRGVPTIHLYHGVVTVQAVERTQPYKVNALAQARFAASKLRKALRHVWPAYIDALWRTRARPAEWLRFGVDIVRGALGRFNGVSAADARTDRCCVYLGSDVAHAMWKYGFSSEEVAVVGNPDLIHFGLSGNLIGYHLTAPPRERPRVMYIDTGLIFTGWVYASTDDFVHHIVTTRDQLTKQGLRFIFKPYPQHAKGGTLDQLRGLGIEICTNDEFVPSLQDCCACIAETSTAALVPALMGMPLLLARYGKLRSQAFGRLLTSYPRARFLPSLEEISSVLASERAECDTERTMQWIHVNSGPLPAGKMPERVAQATMSLIRKCAKGSGANVANNLLQPCD